MKSEQLNRWLSLAANIGVIGGLVLVAIQINQNTRITQAQILNDYYLADMQLELAMMGESPAESWVKAVYTPEKLTEVDAAVLDRFFNYGLVQVRRLKAMSEAGLAPPDWEDQKRYLRWHLGNEVGRRWWKYARGPEPTGFEAELDAILTGSEYSGNQIMLDSMIAQQESPE
jgi:hypothetical protein